MVHLLINFFHVYDHLKTLPNVEYSPAIDREELVKHYQESAFFIHPNIWEETFCVSMVEAMRCGAYPIITDIGALSEVAGEKNASVVPIEGTPTSKGYAVTRDFMGENLPMHVVRHLVIMIINQNTLRKFLRLSPTML